MQDRKLSHKSCHPCEHEAHGPQLTHLSEITTESMRLLCNIFSILSLQLMKGSFKQFLVLKKNVFLHILLQIIIFWFKG